MTPQDQRRLLQELSNWAKQKHIFQTTVSSPEVGKTTITYSKPPTSIGIAPAWPTAPVQFVKNIPPKEEEYESGILEELFQMPE